MAIKFEQFQKILDVLFNQILNEWIELINQKLDTEMKNKNNVFTNMIVLRFDNLSKGYLKDALHNSIFRDKVKEIYVSNGWKNIFFDTIWDNTTQQMIYKITLKTKDHAPIV